MIDYGEKEDVPLRLGNLRKKLNLVSLFNLFYISAGRTFQVCHGLPRSDVVTAVALHLLAAD